MATWLNWSVVQKNKCVLSGQVTDVNGKPLDLTNFTLSLVIKPSQTSDDASGTTYVPTITNAERGLWTLTIPGSSLTTPATNWYRLDVLDAGGGVVTANLGNTAVVAA